MADDEKNKEKQEPTSSEREAATEDEKPTGDAGEEEKGTERSGAEDGDSKDSDGKDPKEEEKGSGKKEDPEAGAGKEKAGAAGTTLFEGIREKVSLNRKLTIGIAAAVSAALLFAVGAWAYDSSQQDRIADGVRVGGVEIGGHSADEAREVIQNKVVAPLRRPVFVSFGDQRFKLTAEQFHQKADVDGMVADAVEASRDASLPTRLWRGITGGEVDANIPPRVSYDQDSIDRFVARVADQVDQAPEDASIIPSGDSLTPSPGQDGISVRQSELADAVALEVEDPVGPRRVEAPVRKTKPEVTRAELADQYPTYITIDRANYTLRLFNDLKLAKSYTIAVGQIGLETPAGLYSIQDKQVNPYWHVPDSAWAGSLAGQTIPPGPGNPLQARWMGIYNGAGIHGTTDIGSLGSAASHGCVRMSIPDVIDLFDRVEVGTPVYIQ